VCPYNINKHGGVQEVVLTLKSGLQSKGHSVKIITPRPYGSQEGDIEDVIYVGSSTDFRSPSHTTTQISSTTINSIIDEILTNEKFDILHFHEPWVPFLSRQLLQRSSSVNVATFHAQVPETIMSRTMIRVVNPYMKSVMNYLNELTAVSDSAAVYAMTLTNQPVSIIPNGIDLDKFKRSNETNKSLNRSRSILFVGRLERRKGVKYLFKAYEALIEQNPDVELIIAGDGPGREKLEQYTKESGLTKVSFLGYISDELKLELLQKADLFCSPALYGESFGIVLLEALATGTVVVAGNNSGYIDVMQGTGAISIINPQDVDEFARRLELLLYDQSLRQLWKDWSKEYVLKFNYPNIVNKYEALYRKALKQHLNVGEK
jgi:phosphatidylinositol alpha-mannosyltransferase